MSRPVNTIEPCLSEAKALVGRIKRRLADERHQRLVGIFTALADDDPTVGLLAYYIWRRRFHQQS